MRWQGSASSLASALLITLVVPDCSLPDLYHQTNSKIRETDKSVFRLHILFITIHSNMKMNSFIELDKYEQ
jgi:hypothetical protein